MKNSPKESNLVVQGLLGFLSETGKTNLLNSVADLLTEAAVKTKNADEIVVTSQIALTENALKEVGRIVSGFLRRPLPVKSRIDKSLIGGFTIRVGDFFLDASLAHDLANLKQVILS